MGGLFTISDGMPFTPLISGDAVGENRSGSYDVPNRVAGPACTHLTNPGDPNTVHQSGVLQLSRARHSVGECRPQLAHRSRPRGTGLFGEPQFQDAVHFGGRQAAVSRRNVQSRERANFEPPLPNNSLYNAKAAPLATAGIITATATTSRQIQLALRLVW